MSSPPASVFEPLDVNLLTSWQLISFRKIGSVIEASRVQHLLSMSAYQLLSRNDPNIVSDAVAGRAKIIYALLDRLHLLFPQLPPPTVMHSLELLCLPNCPKGVGQFRLEMTESSLQVCRWLGGDESLATRSTPAHTPPFYWLADANFLRLTVLWSHNLVQDFVHVLTPALQHELEAPHNRRSHPADWKFVATGLSKLRGWFKSNHLPLDRDFEAVQASILSKIAMFPSNRSKSNLSNALNAPVPQGDASLPLPSWYELSNEAARSNTTTTLPTTNQTAPLIRRHDQAQGRARARLECQQPLVSGAD
ncbi:hypothetical protein BJ165DRAFT_1441048 [Panaeolus papilionaceus]|nr:hypothetical protein BJ165DRAFT_1441048 [Panaeolus papilionaceus]